MKKCKTKYVLETFYNGETQCKKALEIVGRENFLLDSGAFSYMNGAKITLQQMQKYINKYIEFINKYDIKYFFEIDVDNIFGLKQVEKWRKQIETKITGQFVDNMLFAIIAFYGILPNKAIISMIIGGTIFETIYEMIFYPITKKIIKKIQSIQE